MEQIRRGKRISGRRILAMLLAVLMTATATDYSSILSVKAAPTYDTGAFTVTGGVGGTDYTYESGVLTILTEAELTIANTDTAVSTTDRIMVSTGSGKTAHITLAGVNIDKSANGYGSFVDASAFVLGSDSTAELLLAQQSSNTLQSGSYNNFFNYPAAGLNVPEGATLIIDAPEDGTGALTAVAGTTADTEEGGAGIGSQPYQLMGKLVIKGGTINATGNIGGAGIGMGYISPADAYGGNETIIISGGDVTAQGGALGAGIGGGYYGGLGITVEILGGTVNATGGRSGAGIGGGYSGVGSNVTIRGDNITAIGKNGGAGIGGGDGGYGGTVKVYGGTVSATGSNGGTGIGGGSSGAGGIINIYGGTITAKSELYGAGIGGGGGAKAGTGAAVTITGGSVLAISSTSENIGRGQTYGSQNADSGSLQNAAGENVYLATITLYGVNTPQAVTAIGDEIYGTTDVWTDAAGRLYCYLPTSMTVSSVESAGKVYQYDSVTAKEDGTAAVTLYDVPLAEAPSTTFSFDGASPWHLSDTTSAMEYSLDGGTTWTECTDGSTDLSAKTITQEENIKVRVAATQESYASAVQTIKIGKAAAPSTEGDGKVGMTACEAGKVNGALTGMTPALEYRKLGDSEWIKYNQEGDAKSLLAEYYEVRTAASGTKLESDPIIIRIAAVLAGDGKTTPYQIGSAGELYEFASLVNGTDGKEAETGAKAVLTGDIVLSREHTWVPIGDNADHAYAGIFDGQGHHMSGISMDTEGSSAGLFGYLDSTGMIQNVGVADSYIASSKYAGGICGYSSGIIQNCYNEAVVKAKNTGYAGGICGYFAAGTIRNCYNTGSVSADTSLGRGALCGSLQNGCSIINCCYLMGSANQGIGESEVAAILSMTGVTANDFKSGKVTWLLNGSTATDAVWRQNLDLGDEVDEKPVLTESHNKVYNHEGDSTYEYSNYEHIAALSNQDYPVSVPYTGQAIAAPKMANFSTDVGNTELTEDSFHYTWYKGQNADEGTGVEGLTELESAPVIAGLYTLKVTQAGTTSYSPATLLVKVEITKQEKPDITFDRSYIPDKVYNGEAVSLPLESELAVSGAYYSEVTYTWYKNSYTEENRLASAPKDAGSYILEASLADTVDHAAAKNAKAVKIYQTAGILTVPDSPINKTYGDSAFSLDCSTNGDGTISYKSSDTGIATVNESGVVTIHKAGDAEITVSLAAGTNYEAAADKKVTVHVAKDTATTPDTISRTYRDKSGSNGKAVNIELAALLPADRGTTTYELASNDAEYITDEAVDETGKLTYKVGTTGSVGNVTNLVVTAKSTNYKDITITISITLTEKIQPELQAGAVVSLAEGSAYIYGACLDSKTFADAVFVEPYTDTVVKGTLAFTTPDTIPTVGTTKAEWTFTPKDTNTYYTASGTTTIMVSKAVPAAKAPTVKEFTYNPAKTLKDVIIDGAYGSHIVGDGNATVEGTWKWKSPDIIPEVNNDGYVAVFTPKDTDNYDTVEKTVEVTVTKAVPAVTVLPVASGIGYGQTLALSVLSGGSVRYSNEESAPVVNGTFAWSDITAKPAVADSNNTEYEVTFTPDDMVNYNSCRVKVTLTVNKADKAPNMPQAVMSPAYSVNTAGDIVLPAGWSWRSEDAAKPLSDGVAVTALAVYNGADKGSYENETVEVTITRTACEHKYQNPVFAWSEDGKSCKVTYTCANDAGHTVTYDAVITSVVKTASTCSTMGTTTYTAVYGNDSDTKDVQDIILDADNHEGETEVRDVKAATCTEAGYTGDTYCKACGTKTASGKVINALGHIWGEWVVTTPATYDNEGIETRTCSVCGQSETRTVARLVRTDIEKAAVTGITKLNYTGKALKQPRIKVQVGSITLKAGTDYTVSYRNNKYVGTASAVITGKGAYTGTITKKFSITISKGKTYTVSYMKYKVTNANISGKGTVILTGTTKSKSKLTSLSVGSTVKIGGRTFMITAIGSKALKGYTKLAKVTIGGYVTSIGSEAFSGCKSLKSVKISSKKLKSVGRYAVNGIYKKAVIKAPDSRIKAYIKIFKSSTGFIKSMKVKK